MTLDEEMKVQWKRAIEKGKELGFKQGEEIGFKQGEEIGFKQGEEIGFKQGEEIGRAKGEEIGRADKQREIAKNFKNAGIPIDVIAKNTGLTLEIIEAL